MQFFSTRDHNRVVSASQAIAQGLSDEGGLFVPQSFPQVDVKAICALDYPEMAAAIVGQYLTDYSQEFLQEAAKATYGAAFGGKAGYLAPVSDEVYSLELWHGPTCAFKDYALQLMPRLLVEAKKNLGRTEKTHSAAGLVLAAIMTGFLALALVFPPLAGEPKNDILFYSLKGPGSMNAPLFVSLGIGLAIGFLAQRSRFCTMGAIRDLVLFGQTHLFMGILSLAAAAFVTNLVLGQFHAGFTGQPVAHTMHVWNFLGMALVGWGSVLLGGCPLRQVILAGEGNSDAAVTVTGFLVGAAICHNFGLASSAKGPTVNGMIAVVAGFVILVIIGLTNRERA